MRTRKELFIVTSALQHPRYHNCGSHSPGVVIDFGIAKAINNQRLN